MFEVFIPKVGMGITEVEISKWLIKPGDIVKKGDPIVEINTEKASAELESDHDGTVREILFEEGDMVKVGTIICRIG